MAGRAIAPERYQVKPNFFLDDACFIRDSHGLEPRGETNSRRETKRRCHPHRRPRCQVEFCRLHAPGAEALDQSGHAVQQPLLHSLLVLPVEGQHMDWEKFVHGFVVTDGCILTREPAAHNHNVTNVVPPYGKLPSRAHERAC